MIWLALGLAAALQLLAGVLRVRGWFHVIRHACPDSTLRYRDVAVAHLGGCGLNAILPARAGDAVKVPLAAVDAALTAVLVATLVAGGALSTDVLASLVPGATSVPVTAAVACAGGVLLAVLFRNRLGRLVRDAILKLIGIGLATAIIVDATIVRMILVPAIMELLGEKAWWAPRWLKRLVPEVNLEGGAPRPATA